MHARFLEAGLVDELAVVVAPRLAGGDGISLLAGRGPARMAEALRAGARCRWSGSATDVLVSGRVPRGKRRSPLAKSRSRG